jgi:hypothetical protein
MLLIGVRRQLTEAREALVESASFAGEGKFDPAYRAALKSRNLLFHATRGLAAARGEPMPEMPVVSTQVGTLADHVAALAELDAALSTDDASELDAMPPRLAAAKAPYGRYLGWLRFEVGKMLHPPKP